MFSDNKKQNGCKTVRRTPSPFMEDTVSGIRSRCLKSLRKQDIQSVSYLYKFLVDTRSTTTVSPLAFGLWLEALSGSVSLLKIGNHPFYPPPLPTTIKVTSVSFKGLLHNWSVDTLYSTPFYPLFLSSFRPLISISYQVTVLSHFVTLPSSLFPAEWIGLPPSTSLLWKIFFL